MSLQTVAKKPLDAGAPPHIVLHYMTQNGQPLGSTRRCCERCGVRLWLPTDGSYVDEKEVYHNPPRGYVACWLPKAFAEERRKAYEASRARALREREHRAKVAKYAVRLAEEREAEGNDIFAKWAIMDRETQRPYVGRSYATRRLAEQAMADLLRVYPAGHEWRERLHVRGRKASDEDEE